MILNCGLTSRGLMAPIKSRSSTMLRRPNQLRSNSKKLKRSVAFFEEFLFRGYAQFTLTRGIGFWPAALALSCGFGLSHLKNLQEHWPGLVAAAFIGLFFCLTLRRTGNLWFAVAFHAAWDWGETFFYSVPDSGISSPGHLLSSDLHGAAWRSGGSTGPEGSVFCFLVIALVWVLFAKTYRRKELSSE